MTELAAAWGTRAERLEALAQELQAAGDAVMWRGPDADAHGARRGQALGEILALVEEILERAQELREHAEEQSEISAPEAGGGKEPAAALIEKLVEIARGMGPEETPLPDVRHYLTGDPEALDRLARVFADYYEESPESVLNMIALHPGEPSRAHEDLERFREFLERDVPAEALDVSHRTGEQAAGISDRLLGLVPGGSLALGAMDLHGGAGEMLDGIAEDAPWARPVLAPARVSHALSGALIGEDSVLGQLRTGVEGRVANVLQTGKDVSAAVGAGDIGGVARAVDQGFHRDLATTIDLVTANPLPAWGHAAGEVSHAVGDALDPIAPQAAARAHEVGEGITSTVEQHQRRWEDFTSADALYENRRRVVPMPWDATV